MTRPPRTDVILAAALVAAAAVEHVLAEPLPAVALLSVPACAAVAWRRVAPVAACLTAIVLFGLPEFVVAGTADWFTGFVAVVVTLFSVAAHARSDRVAGGAAAATALIVAVSVRADLADGAQATAGAVASGVLFGIVILAAPSLLIGFAARRQTALRARLEEQRRALERERERHAAAAAAAERARVADDLHDVVAAGVRSMLAELGPARAAVAARAPGADAAILRVEQRGRQALGEMRGLLGVLRRGDEDLALAPQPSLARLDLLARRLTASGHDVRLEVRGTPRVLTPGLDVAAYRVVEDTLRRAATAAHADVLVRWSGGAVELEIGVDGPELADAAALTAVRERVALFAGRVDAGRRTDGGSALRAALPVEAGR